MANEPGTELSTNCQEAQTKKRIIQCHLNIQQNLTIAAWGKEDRSP